MIRYLVSNKSLKKTFAINVLNVNWMVEKNFFLYIIFAAKLLVASGGGGGGATKNGFHSEVIAIGTEHITSEYTTCQELPKAPYEVLGGTGGFVHHDVLFCGGTNMNGNEKYKKCWSLKKDTTINMSYERVRASGIVVEDKVSNLISYTIHLGI